MKSQIKTLYKKDLRIIISCFLKDYNFIEVFFRKVQNYYRVFVIFCSNGEKIVSFCIPDLICPYSLKSCN